MKFSKRTSFGDFEPNALTRLLGKRKAAGPVLDLTESNPTRCAFRSLNAAILARFTDPSSLHYEPDPRGLRAAREAVRQYYAEKKISVDAEDIFLTCGTSEAYSMLFHLLCEAGEEILCQTPVYPLVDHLAAYAGIEAKRFDRLPSVPEKAKAVVVVNPANPTGQYTDERSWTEIEKFCRTNGLPIISDEVFFEYDWQDRPRVSGASRTDGLHFTLNGVSKMLGLPQMKLAWIVLSGPQKERREAAGRLEAIADAFLSVNTPAQNALPFWLEKRHAFLYEIKDRLKTNFAALCGALGPIPEPEGGWYALVPLGRGRSDEETALRILERQNVLVHPGYFFDLEKECLVLSLLPEPSLFSEAARRLSLERPFNV